MCRAALCRQQQALQPAQWNSRAAPIQPQALAFDVEGHAVDVGSEPSRADGAQLAAHLEEAATQADNAFRIARLRYDEGEEDLLNVLTIQQRVISARSSLSTAERLLLEQRVNLSLALGGSWTN